MTRWLAAAVTLLLVLALAGCMGQRGPSGFRLPPGDAEAGRATFVTLESHSCHTVAGVPDLPPPRMTPPIALGGKVPLPRTDGDLTTDIILPSSHFARGYPAEHVPEGARIRCPGRSTARPLTGPVRPYRRGSKTREPRPAPAGLAFSARPGLLERHAGGAAARPGGGRPRWTRSS